eukprot:6489049-Amphidinium_carterae.2
MASKHAGTSSTHTSWGQYRATTTSPDSNDSHRVRQELGSAWSQVAKVLRALLLLYLLLKGLRVGSAYHMERCRRWLFCRNRLDCRCGMMCSRTLRCTRGAQCAYSHGDADRFKDVAVASSNGLYSRVILI